MRKQLWIAFAVLAIGDVATSPTSAARATAMAQAGDQPDGQVDGEAVPAETPTLAEAVARALEPGTKAASRLIHWVIVSGDNGELPFIVIDKDAATVAVFNPRGEIIAETPALIGIAPGDESTPGIGERPLAEMGPEEKTTPAGRFQARFGPAIGGQPVLWVDYANSVALHPVITGNPRERRLQRLQSPEADDNRITFGCINVPVRFFTRFVRPYFGEGGGIVYILPDARPLDDVFPLLRSTRRTEVRASR
jgi:hypothetical protein